MVDCNKGTVFLVLSTFITEPIAQKGQKGTTQLPRLRALQLNLGAFRTEAYLLGVLYKGILVLGGRSSGSLIFVHSHLGPSHVLASKLQRDQTGGCPQGLGLGVFRRLEYVGIAGFLGNFWF